MAAPDDPKVIPLRKVNNTIRDRVAAMDARYLDPTERAEAVNEFLSAALGYEGVEAVPEDIHWDLTCFASQYLAALALGSGDKDFLELIKAVNANIFAVHYSFPDEHPCLGSERVERMKFWVSLKKKAKTFLGG